MPPSTDKKAKRANSKPGGAKYGHKGHFRKPSEAPDTTVDHLPSHCDQCGSGFDASTPSDLVQAYDLIDLPQVKPVVEQHRRLACNCSCGARTIAPLPDAAKGSPFGPGITSQIVYLKSFQLFSYERLQSHLLDVCGLKISQGAIMNIIERANSAFEPEYQAIVGRLRSSTAIACDETGMRIEGCNAQQWVFVADDAIVHCADFTRKAAVIDTMLAGHVPDFWLSDRYAGQQKKAKQHQTCLAHLARDVARIEQVGDEALGFRLKLWMGDVFRFASGIFDLAKSTIKTKVRELGRRIDDILLWEGTCEETGKVVGKFRKARDQLLVFAQAPELVDATNNKSERALRPSVIMRKVTNGFRAKWAADADCRVRTVVDTAKLSGISTFKTIFATLSA